MNTARPSESPVSTSLDYRSALPLPRGFVAALVHGRMAAARTPVWTLEDPPADLDQRVRNAGEW